MKNIVNKLIIIAIVLVTIGTIVFANNVYASFAEFDDETADKQANEDLKEQAIKDAENAGKSNNNYLKELSIKGYELTPKFNKQTINYTIDEEILDSEIEITATSDDDRAIVAGTGKIELKSGENNLMINVTAENGIKRTYFIKVNKKTTIESEEKEEESENIYETNVVQKESEITSNQTNNKQKTIISIAIILVIFIIIILFAKRKNNIIKGR